MSCRDGEMEYLFKAALFNDIPAAERALKKPVDINNVNRVKLNALNIAVGNDHRAMVRWLVKNGAIVDNQRTRSSPLVLAIKSDFKEMADILIELGASIEKGRFDDQNISPLRIAVRSLNPNMVEFMIQKGANVRAKDLQTKRTALHEVGDYINNVTKEPATKVRLKIAKILLDNKADVCAKDSNCRTPLDGAIIDNVELSKFFITEGAPVRRRMDNGFVIEYMLYVTKFNSPELIRLCLERGGDYSHAAVVDEKFISSYHRSLRESTPEVVKVFWKFGCPVDLPVHEASFAGVPLDCWKVQVNRGNLELFETQLDFFMGISKNNLKQVLATVKKGAEPKGSSLQIASPLHHLASTKNGNHKIVQVLLENGVAVNKLAGAVKKTSLFYALLHSNLNILKEILKFGGCVMKQDLGVLIRVKNKEIHTIMGEITKAFKFTRKGSNQVLKQIKAFVKAKNKDMVQILMNCVDRKGRSLMGLSLDKGHVKLAEKLMKLRIEQM